MNTRTKWLLFGVAFFAFYTLYRFGYAVVQPPGFIPNDFTTFHTAADRLARGVSFYQGDDDSPFKYSPTFLVIFYPLFTGLSKYASWFVWCALSAFGLSATLFIFLHKGLPAKLDRRFFLALATSVVFGWHGYIEHFSYGQVDVLLLACFVAATVAPRMVAVALMSFVLITKPQAAILLSFWAFTQEWRRIGEILVGTFILLILPALWWGVPHHIEFFRQWKSCLGKQDYIFMTGNLNQSFAAALARILLHKPWVSALSMLSITAAAIASIALALRIRGNSAMLKQLTKPDLRLRLACVTLGIYLVVTPLSWRWLTFIWMPMATLLWTDLFSQTRTNKTMSVSLVVFSLAGLILQRVVANAIGIPEVDELSWAGLYALGNLCLLIAATSNIGILYFQKSKSRI